MAQPIVVPFDISKELVLVKEQNKAYFETKMFIEG